MDKNSPAVGNLIFNNPPLVEVMVELRWGAPSTSQPSRASLEGSLCVALTKYEELFEKFSDKVVKK